MEPLPSVVQGFDGVVTGGVDPRASPEQKEGLNRRERRLTNVFPVSCSPSYSVKSCRMHPDLFDRGVWPGSNEGLSPRCKWEFRV